MLIDIFWVSAPQSFLPPDFSPLYFGIITILFVCSFKTIRSFLRREPEQLPCFCNNGSSFNIKPPHRCRGEFACTRCRHLAIGDYSIPLFTLASAQIPRSSSRQCACFDRVAQDSHAVNYSVPRAEASFAYVDMFAYAHNLAISIQSSYCIISHRKITIVLLKLLCLGIFN